MGRSGLHVLPSAPIPVTVVPASLTSIREPDTMRIVRTLIATLALSVLVGGLSLTMAGAQEYPVTTPTSAVGAGPDVGGDVTAPEVPEPEVPEPEVLGAVQTGQQAAGLPVTGADLVGLALLGGGAVAVGTVMVRARRTTR
jgi:hypothetical protein